MADPATPAPAKSRLKSLVLYGVLSAGAVGAGYVVPSFVLPHPPEEGASQEQRHGSSKPAFVSFGDVVVNLAEERLTRYLRVKIILVISEADQKEFVEALPNKKAILKHWLISYLSDRSIQEVTGAAGVNRLRREILDQFNALLYPDGAERIRDVLFEEFNVQ